jgi:hypothetical protein
MYNATMQCEMPLEDEFSLSVVVLHYRVIVGGSLFQFFVLCGSRKKENQKMK